MTNHAKLNQLATKAQTGDPDALVELLVQTKSYVRAAVKKVTRTGSSVEEADLMAEGKVSILRHLHKYDADRGNFATFIFRRLRGDVMDAASNLFHGFSVPEASLRRYRRAMAACGGNATEAREYVVTHSTMGEDTFDAVHQAITGTWHLSALGVSGDKDGSSAVTHSLDLEDRYLDVVNETVMSTLEREEVARAMEQLSDKEREVISLVFGFTSEPMSDVQAAKALGTHASTVCRIRNRAQLRLANLLEESK